MSFYYKVSILSSSNKTREFMYKGKSCTKILEKMKKENPSALYITVSLNDTHEEQWINPRVS